MAMDGIVISVPSETSVSKPIHVFHLSTGLSDPSADTTRTFFEVGSGSKVVLVEEFLALDEKVPTPNLSLSMMQMKVGANARVDYCRVVSQTNAHHLGKVVATLDRASHLASFSLTSGSKLARIDIEVNYTAPDAECWLNGLYLVNDGEHVDHHTSVDHNVNQCRTHQFYKGILNGAAKAVFNGKIFIRKGTVGSEAYQTNKNLLLSENAEVNTKPQLEIDSDDVKASHGAAIGSINPLELFYLQSRCIGRSEAMAMLCRGFADDVVLKSENKLIVDVLADRVAAWFHYAVSTGGHH
jgi:Fe-S cluster assembly protein SufD